MYYEFRLNKELRLPDKELEIVIAKIVIAILRNKK